MIAASVLNTATGLESGPAIAKGMALPKAKTAPTIVAPINA